MNKVFYGSIIQIVFYIIFCECHISQHFDNIKNQTQSETNSYGLPQAGGNNNNNALTSPFNIFLKNDGLITYFTHILIVSNYQAIQYESQFKVAFDINLPFIFLTDKRNSNDSQHFTKLTPTDDQKNVITNYLKPSFPQILEYVNDLFYVLNESIWINQYIRIEIGFFYLMGNGAKFFQQQLSLDGFIGLGKNSYQQSTKINLVSQLYEAHKISQKTYSLYIGNSIGNYDSVLFFGGYQDIFINNNSQLYSISLINGCNQLWCFPINQILLFKNTTKIFASDTTKTYSAYVSSIYQFIYIPKEIAEAIQFHIEQDKTIECEFKNFPLRDNNNTVLQCSTKLQISIPQKFPFIQFNIVQKSTIIQIVLSPEQYIQKCLDDVETYAFECYTYFSIYDEENDENLPNFDIIFGLPFLRVYYSYYDIDQETLFISRAFQEDDITLISKFWYYSFMALLICWAMVMMSCGLFFKEQMDQMIVFVNNILIFFFGNQQTRQQILLEYLSNDE